MSRRSLLTALVVGLVSMMTLVGLILAMSMATGATTGLTLGGRIAVVEVDGLIADDQQFLRDVRRLRSDRSVQGWVVAVNSPGGAVGPAQSMFETLRRIREEDGVPIVASIGGVGASGGYYVAMAADSVLALPGSITGSIGVLLEYPNVQGLMERIGVRMEVVKGGEQKDLGSPFRDMEPAHREILVALVEDVHLQFMEAVAGARTMTIEQVRPLSDGRVLSGRQALAAGLIDRLGNRDEAIAVAGRMAGLGPTPRIVRPPEPRRPWLLDMLFGAGAATTVRQMAESVARGSGPSLKYIVH